MPYTAKEAIQPVGNFWCDVFVNKRPNHVLQRVKFTVIPGNAESLLGVETAKKLGVVKIIANIDSLEDYEAKYPRVFAETLGKAHDMIKLTIRDDIEPVSYTHLTLPTILLV